MSEKASWAAYSFKGPMGRAVARKIENGTRTGHLSRDEAWTAIRGLSDEQRSRLARIERRHRGGTYFAEGDLLHEAIAAAITGKKKCPRRTDVAAFLAQSMRNIAGRRRARLRRQVPLDGPDGVERNRSTDEANPEEALIGQEGEELLERAAKEALSIIFEVLKDDQEATRVLQGLAEGKRGKALRGSTGLDQTALDYAVKRIRRVRFPEGWAP
jgi:DNA-directed RNA polymerase specialized sigma24 family protein